MRINTVNLPTNEIITLFSFKMILITKEHNSIYTDKKAIVLLQ